MCILMVMCSLIDYLLCYIFNSSGCIEFDVYWIDTEREREVWLSTMQQVGLCLVGFRLILELMDRCLYFV